MQAQDILGGYAQQRALRLREVRGVGQLLHRFCDERQRGAQVVRDVGKENELRARRGFEALVEGGLLVALPFQHTVLLFKDTLVFLALPEGPERQEHDAEE